jgi:serine/threonine-protein kinase
MLTYPTHQPAAIEVTRADSFASDLERIAASVADGDTLDWNLLEAQEACDPETRAALGKLDLISRAFRSDKQKSPSQQDEVAFRFAGLDAIEKIAEGGQGEVWRARDRALKREVALKLHKGRAGGMSDSIIEEGRKLARLDHPHVVRIYGAAVDGNRSGMWMELVKGESMQARLSRMGPLDAKDVVLVALDVCSALIAIHGQGFAHGDVKPENVMRDENGRTVLIDFGSARRFNLDSGSNVSGTRAYVAPEILDGGATEPASDVYALAMLMFHLVTARFPPGVGALHLSRRDHRFESGKRSISSRNGGSSSLRSIAPTVSAAMADLIQRGVARDAARRPSNALEFQAELQALVKLV